MIKCLSTKLGLSPLCVDSEDSTPVGTQSLPSGSPQLAEEADMAIHN